MDKMELKTKIGGLLLAFGCFINVSLAQINKKAPATTRDSVLINAPIETVWQALADVKKWPKKYDFILTTQLETPLSIGQKFKWKTKKLDITSTVTNLIVNKQLCWKGKKYGVLVYHNWLFIVINANQTLLISEESQQGMAVQLLKKKFRKSLKEGSIKWLSQIKKASEN